jgi:hypothetical protein
MAKAAQSVLLPALLSPTTESSISLDQNASRNHASKLPIASALLEHNEFCLCSSAKAAEKQLERGAMLMLWQRLACWG